MKELSIEEKAKAYDEAIKRVENIKTGKCKTTFMFTEGLFEHIFPELAESEDERIRKMIINTLNRDEILTEDEAYDCIAWLEKQGENSVCKVKIGETYKCIASPRYTCFRTGDIYHVKDNFVAELINTCSGCFVLLEKQGEQKPAIKIELDDNGEPVLTPFEAELFSMMSEAWQCYSFGEEVNIAKIVKEHSSELLERVNEQKSAWSEEDELRLDDIKTIIEESIFSKVVRDKNLDWLKSLKDRYTWKPSDEQINILFKYAEQNNKDGSILTSLYQDLKKLKG